MKNELSVVSKSKSLVRLIYKIIKRLPEIEKYVLVSQMLRCSVSIPSNICEGQQRSDKEFIRFLGIARGSLFELKVQCEICYEEYGFKVFKGEDYLNILNLIDEIGRMSYGLMLKLKSEADNNRP